MPNVTTNTELPKTDRPLHTDNRCLRCGTWGSTLHLKTHHDRVCLPDQQRRSTKHQKKSAWLLCGLHPLSYWHLLHLGDGPQTTGVAGIPQTKSCSLSMPKVVVPQAVCSVHMISKSRKGYRCADSLVQAAHITCGVKDIIHPTTTCYSPGTGPCSLNCSCTTERSTRSSASIAQLEKVLLRYYKQLWPQLKLTDDVFYRLMK